jgi:hypothetical protein
MKMRLPGFLFTTLSLIFSIAAAAGQSAAESKFEPLFNGRDLSGWHGMGHFDPYELQAMPKTERDLMLEKANRELVAHWRVEGNEIVNDGNGPFLTSNQDFGDIELKLEYKTVAKADSGVYLRGSPQVQIWDTTREGGKWKSGADKGSGGLWNNSEGAPGKYPLVLADRPFGDWNDLRIIQVGERTTVFLNGSLVVDHARMENFWDRALPLPVRGPLQFQTHGGEIRWRNILVREIPADEASRILAENHSEGFTAIFDGRNLDGWAGPIDNYAVQDGTVTCLPGKGGTIYFNRELKDFQARLEFQLPPGGNNGLAIRYPGKGDTAYVGMCELQVLDNTAEQYAKLDPRQFHGSVYGMIAAKRGYQRPVGEWNFQEVTVQGSRIKVELNGTLILDGDVSTVTDFAYDDPHPGKDRTSGFFGLAGHNDPVKYRNISIRELD